jgi:iron complex outermembrane receptor protein
MKPSVFSCVFLLLGSTAFAQWNLQLNSALTQRPLAGATFSNGFLIRITDPNGTVNLPFQAEQTWIIRYLGFQSDTLITPKNSNECPSIWTLKPQAFVQPEYVVRLVESQPKLPITHTRLEKTDLEPLNSGRDLPMLLDQTASVVTHSDAGAGIGYTGIRIRGTDQTRINVTINGIPVNDPESQGVFWVNTPDLISSASSIEIQRGAGTNTQGAGSFGGAIHLNTLEQSPTPFANYRFSAGSFNSLRNTLEAGTGRLKSGFSAELRLSKIQSDGFIDRASSDLRSYYLKTAYQNEKSALAFHAFSGIEKTYQAWYGVPQLLADSLPSFNPAGFDNGKKSTPYENETDNYQQDHYQLFFTHRFKENINLRAAGFYTRGRGYYEQYKVQDYLPRYGLTSLGDFRDTSDLIRRLWLDNHFFGGNAVLAWAERHWNLTGGLGLYHYIGQHFGTLNWAQYAPENGYNLKYYDHPAEKTEYNAFARATYSLNAKIALSADVQYRGVHYTIQGFNNQPNLQVNDVFHFLNPRGGITWNPHQMHELSAFFGIAQKEPNRVDYETGPNQKPRHEVLRDVELAYRISNKKAWSRITGFWMDYSDQLVLTGAINDVGAYTRTNAPKSYRLGLEWEWMIKPKPFIWFSGNMTYSQNRILDFIEYLDDYDNNGQIAIVRGTTPIAFSPDFTAAATLTFIPFKNLEIRWAHKGVSQQFLDNSGLNSRSLPAFYSSDLGLFWTHSWKNGLELGLHCTLFNLWNARYAPNGYTFSYLFGGETTTENFVYPMAGRNFMAGFTLSFN